MKTATEIYDELLEISSSMNWTGPEVETTCRLLSYAIYMKNVDALGVGMESSFTRSTLLNSRITHAQSFAHSVFRGKNQRIQVRNASPLSAQSVKKFSLNSKVSKFYLYYDKDYDFTINDTYDFDLIVSESEVFQQQVTVTPDKYSVIVPGTNISEDLIIYYNDATATTEFPHTGELMDLITSRNKADEEDIIIKMLTQTMSDFGLLLWKEEAFVSSDILRVDYLPYSENELDPNQIKTLNGFVLKEATITSNPVESRTEDLEQIYLDAMLENRSGFLIKGTRDIKETIFAYFGTKVTYINLDVGVEPVEDYLAPTGALPDRGTGLLSFPQGLNTVYYLRPDPTEFLDESDVVNFIDKQKSYYITQDWIFIKAEAADTPYAYNAEIHYTESPSVGEIDSVFQKYEKQIGGNIDPYSIAADIVKISGVAFVKLMDETRITEINLDDNEYTTFSRNLKYVFVTT